MRMNTREHPGAGGVTSSWFAVKGVIKPASFKSKVFVEFVVDEIVRESTDKVSEKF